MSEPKVWLELTETEARTLASVVKSVARRLRQGHSPPKPDRSARSAYEGPLDVAGGMIEIYEDLAKRIDPERFSIDPDTHAVKRVSPRPCVLAHSARVEERMRANDHKPGVPRDADPVDVLLMFAKLTSEIGEVADELFEGPGVTPMEWLERIRNECADVSAVAVLLVEAAEKAVRNRSEKKT